MFYQNLISVAMLAGCGRPEAQARSLPGIATPGAFETMPHPARLQPLAVGLPPKTVTNTFTVGWLANTNAAFTRVYWGYAPASYLQFVDSAGTAAELTVIRTNNQTVYLAATHFSHYGVESDNSKEITFPYHPQWLILSWERSATVIVQACASLREPWQDFTNATGTTVQFDVPEQTGFYRLCQPQGGPPLRLAIKTL